MTNKEMLENIVNGNINEEVQAKAAILLHNLNKRDAKRNAENEPILADIREVLVGEAKTAQEVRDNLGQIHTIQKISAMLRILRADGIVEVVPVKREGKSAQNAYQLV